MSGDFRHFGLRSQYIGVIVLNGGKGDRHMMETGRAGREYRALKFSALLRRKEPCAFLASQESQGALSSGTGHSHSQNQLSSEADMLAEAVPT